MVAWLVASAWCSALDTAETADTGFEAAGPALRAWFQLEAPEPGRTEPVMVVRPATPAVRPPVGGSRRASCGRWWAARSTWCWSSTGPAR